MSDHATSPARTQASRRESTFPQWLLEIIRPCVRFFSRLFWKIQFSGLENVPLTSGVIVAANHQTYLDPFWLSIPIRRPTRYLAWSVAFDWPVVGRALRWLGAWPIAIEGSDPAAIRRSLQWLRTGGMVVIFPEGGRSTDTGALERFKVGAVRLALEADVPILPVTIRGGNRIWPRGWRFPRLGKVEVIYHPLVRIKTAPQEETRKCAKRETEQLARIIGAAL